MLPVPGGRVPKEVLLDEEEPQEVRVCPLDQDQPGAGHGEKGGDPDGRDDFRQIPPPAGYEKPERQDGQRKDDADQALGQEGEGGEEIKEVKLRLPSADA